MPNFHANIEQQNPLNPLGQSSLILFHLAPQAPDLQSPKNNIRFAVAADFLSAVYI